MRLAAISRRKDLSLSRQCELLNVHRGRLYYRPLSESPLNLRILRLMDKHYIDYPDKGPRRMCKWLNRQYGIDVNI